MSNIVTIQTDLEYGATIGELDNELVGCREVSFKAQAERDRLAAQYKELLDRAAMLELHMNKAEKMAGELGAERDRLAAQVSAMREAMGEEWIPIGAGWNPANPDALHCPECLNQPKDGHKSDCGRGRFFAALAAPEGQ